MAIKKIECAGLIGCVSPNAEGRWSMSRKITRTGGNKSSEKSNFLFAIIAMIEISIDIAKRANSCIGIAASGLNVPILTSDELTTKDAAVNTRPRKK
jgi:hypothetical protein